PLPEFYVLVGAYYGTNATSGYWVDDRTAWIEAFPAWQRANERLRELADAYDFLCPSLYARYSPDENKNALPEWSAFAHMYLREAWRISGGKPLVPFLSARYVTKKARIPLEE